MLTKWIFFGYDKQALIKNARFPICVLPSADDVYHRCASDMLEVIIENNAHGEPTVLVLPLGPEGQYPLFATEVNARRISLSDVYFILMDAYIENGKDLPYSHTRSARRRADELIFNRIDPALAPSTELVLHMRADDVGFVNRRLAELGKIDLCVAGIGINGHIGFNEQVDATPEEYLAQAHSRILALSTETRLITAINCYHGALAEVPRFGITIGLAEMMRAKKIRVYCFRDWHNACIKRAACDKPSGRFPATLLQLHADVVLYCHEAIVKPIRFQI